MKKTLISTYRNDYVKYRNVYIDGGLDYIKTNSDYKKIIPLYMDC